jgi:hypothetical protein
LEGRLGRTRVNGYSERKREKGEGEGEESACERGKERNARHSRLATSERRDATQPGQLNVRRATRLGSCRWPGPALRGASAASPNYTALSGKAGRCMTQRSHRNTLCREIAPTFTLLSAKLRVRNPRARMWDTVRASFPSGSGRENVDSAAGREGGGGRNQRTIRENSGSSPCWRQISFDTWNVTCNICDLTAFRNAYMKMHFYHLESFDKRTILRVVTKYHERARIYLKKEMSISRSRWKRSKPPHSRIFF